MIGTLLVARMAIDVIIPALNEAQTIAEVVRAVPRPPVRTVHVVDNGSVDGTADVARAAGARIVSEPRRGYGSACLAGLRAIPMDTEIVVFLDADGSDDPSYLPALVKPIEEGTADLAIGYRASHLAAPGALTPQQRFGNAIASWWLRSRFGLPARDLGPFRAIRRSALDRLGMSDPDYGWTIEMQIKAARRGLRYVELAVPSRPRAGNRSKVSGTVAGTLGASFKILFWLARYDFFPPKGA